MIKKIFDRYGKTYQTFNTELYQGKANQITIDLPVSQDIHLNGRVELKLRVKSRYKQGLIISPTVRTWTKEISTALSSGFKC